jgi:hypothetical protein
MFQLLPVIDQNMSVSTTTTTTNSPHHAAAAAEDSPDQKLKKLVDHFEKKNSSESSREHIDFLAFLNTKKVPDDILHLLYNEVMIKKNKHKFIDQPATAAEATNGDNDVAAVKADETPAGIAVATAAANAGGTPQNKKNF